MLAAVQGGEPLSLFGTDYPTPDGTCIRDFVHVADLASAHLGALSALEAGGASSAFNLGIGEGCSVREALDAAHAVTGREVPHSVGPRRAGDPARLVASSAKARAELGWSPKFEQVESIVETAWRWHTQHPEGYGPDETGST